jgi:hypothetical protein
MLAPPAGIDERELSRALEEISSGCGAAVPGQRYDHTPHLPLNDDRAADR